MDDLKKINDGGYKKKSRKVIKNKTKRKVSKKSKRKVSKKSKRKVSKKSRKTTKKKSRKAVKNKTKKKVSKSKRKVVKKKTKRKVSKSKRKVSKSKRKVSKSKRKVVKNKTKRKVSKSKRKVVKNKSKRKVSRNFKIKDTIDDGNCFYSSVYRSLSYSKLLNDVYECFPQLKSKTEKEFIKKLRYIIAENSNDDIINMFNNFININLDEETFNEIIEYLGCISNVLKEFYETNKFETKYEVEFIEKVKNSIKKDKNWTGEIDVNNLIRIFKEQCNINVKTYNNYKNLLKDIKSKNEKTIYLLNMNETHWVYV